MEEEEQKDLEEHYSNLNYWTILGKKNIQNL
jgi:hypothetical protein